VKPRAAIASERFSGEGSRDLGDPKRESLKVSSQRAVLAGVFHPDDGFDRTNAQFPLNEVMWPDVWWQAGVVCGVWSRTTIDESHEEGSQWCLPAA
jgi:hypothetical protein